VKGTYNPKTKDNLLDLLIQLLREKLRPMLKNPKQKANLRAGIQTYIDKVKSKLNKREFSRLISAKLTYREVKALEKFLEKMDLESYIAGKEVE